MTSLFDVLPCGFVSFSDDGTILECNHTLTSWLGYSKEELTGKSVEHIFTIASRIFYNTHLFPLIKLHGRADEIFLSLRGKNSADVSVLANAHRLNHVESNNIHCVFIRVEERKKFEQELIEAKRQAENALKENKALVELTKSLEKQTVELERQHQHLLTINNDLLQFSKIISHDLQEPIHKIQLFIDIITRDQDNVLTPRSKILHEKVNAAAARLKRLTQSLDDYIAFDKEENLSVVDLMSVITKAASRASARRQFFDFDLRLEKMPSLEGYESQLESLFFHLIDNAIQFREPSRKLVIKIDHVIIAENIFRVSKTQYKYVDHLRIFFSDNGMGFPEEYNDYIFVLLKKIHDSTGLGMGLPLVKKIVQKHFGQIRVKSQPQVGTHFEIELPINVG